MAIFPHVPRESRAALEAWLREKANDPVIFARLHADFRGTIQSLVGKRPPAALNIQLHVVASGKRVRVQRYRGDLIETDGERVTTVARRNVAASNADRQIQSRAVDSVLLTETETMRYFVLRPPTGKPGSAA